MSVEPLFSKDLPTVKGGLTSKKFSISKAVLPSALLALGSSSKEGTPLTSLESQEQNSLIEQYSALETPVTKSIGLQGDHLPSLLGQLNAAELIGGSNLEILPTHIGVKILSKGVEAVEHTSVPPSLVQLLTQVHANSVALAALPGKMTQALHDHQAKLKALEKKIRETERQTEAIDQEIKKIDREIQLKEDDKADAFKLNPYLNKPYIAKINTEIQQLQSQRSEKCEDYHASKQSISGLKEELSTLQTMIPEAIPLKQSADELMKTIYDLQEEATYVIEGGRIESNGVEHPVFFEFLKKNDMYNLTVYLADPEAGGYCDTLYHDHVTMIRPLHRYTRIPSAVLFFNEGQGIQSDFFQTILETKVLQNQSFTTIFVAIHILGHLQRFRIIEPENETSGFIAALRSKGPWGCIKALMFHHLKPELYKKIIVEIKWRSLIEGYQMAKQRLAEDVFTSDQLRFVLKRGAEALLRRILQLEAKGWIDPLVIKKYRATALDLQRKVEAAQQAAEQTRQKQIVFFDPTTLTQGDRPQDRLQAIERAKEEILIPKSADPSSPSPLPRQLVLAEAAQLNPQLKSLIEGYTKEAIPCSVQDMEIAHLVRQLPIPDHHGTSAYWSKVSDIPEVVSSLHQLSSLYDRATRSIGAKVTPYEANTVFTLYALIYHLAVKMEEEREGAKIGTHSLRYYPIYFPAMALDQDEYLVYTFPQDYHRIQELIAYFKGVQLRNPNLGSSWKFDWLGRLGWEKKGHVPAALFDYQAQRYVSNTDADMRGMSMWFLALINTNPSHAPSGDKAAQVANLYEALNPACKNNFFSKSGLGYIHSLAYSAFLAHQFGSHLELRQETDCSFSVVAQVNQFTHHADRHYFICYSCGVLPLNNEECKSASRSLYPKLDDKTHNLLTGHKWNKRVKPEDSTLEEGEVLKEQDGQPLLRIACEPHLFLHKLLTYFQSRLELLESSQEQIIFEIGLFRSVSLNPTSCSLEAAERELLTTLVNWNTYLYERHLPLQEEMKQKAFQDVCQQFIQAGIDRYWLREPNQRPKIFPLLFFIRLALRLTRYEDAHAGSVHLTTHIHHLKNLMARTDLTLHERSALCIHLCLAHGEQKTITAEECEQLFGAWVFYKNTPLPAQWHYPLLEKEVMHGLMAHSWQLTQISHTFSKLFNETLQQLGVGTLPPECSLKILQPHVVRAETGEKTYWEMDLLVGTLRNESGVLQKIVQPNWFDNTLFKRLFGENCYECRQIGNVVYFNDPNLGIFRLFNKAFRPDAEDEEKNLQFGKGLQRNYQGVWYQFIPLHLLKNQGFPHSLLADHTHWISVEASAQNSLVIWPKEGMSPTAFVTSTGQITTDRGQLKGIAIDPTLTLFESPDYILFEEEHLAHGKIATFLALTRYISFSEQPLKFEVVDGKAIYGADRSYALSQDQQQGLLGGIKQYLLLTHVGGKKRKMLVPLRLLHTIQPMGREHQIHVQNSDEKEETSQKGRFFYIEFDLIGNEPKPMSQEGTLYLAYLRLTQREYQKARGLIDRIDYREPIAVYSFWALERILLFAQNWDPGSEAAAVALHAWVLIERAREKVAVEKRRWPYKEIERSSVVATYYRYRYRIPQTLLLTPEQARYVPKEKTHLRHTQYKNVHEYQLLPYTRPFNFNKPKLGYPDDGFSLSHYGYGDRQNSRANRYQAVRETPFLPGEEQKMPPSIYRAPYLLTHRYGDSVQHAIFQKAYQIAQSGSAGEKAQLCFRLHVGQVNNEKIKNDKSKPAAGWSYLQLALRSSSAPKLPNHTDPEARWEFLKLAYAEADFLDRVSSNQSSGLEATTLSNSEENPLPKRAVLAPLLPPKKIEPVEEQIQLIIPGTDHFEQGLFQDLFTPHFKTLPSSLPQDLNISFAFQPEWIQSKEDANYEAVLRKVADEFAFDYQKGEEANAAHTTYTLTDLDTLQKSLQTHLKHLRGEVADLETAVLDLANRHPPEDLKVRLCMEAGIRTKLSLKNLASLFLKGDVKGFANANSYLKDPTFVAHFAKTMGIEESPNVVINYLYNLTGLHMTLSTSYQRLERAAEWCTKIAQIPDTTSLERDDYVQKLAQTLKPSGATYTASEYPVFLVFEYLTQMQIRPDQARLLKLLLEKDSTGKWCNRVIQLIMGGGKTAVLAVILLKLAARPGRLSLFVVHSSQYASVGYNLRKAMRDHFGQDVEEIDVRREQITLEMCQEIEKRFAQTMERGDCLLVKAETLQCLQLAFLDLVNKACEAATISDEMLDHINSLRRILLTLREKGDALIDEVDLVLNVLQEVNFPVGEEEHIHGGRIALIRDLFALFMNPTAPISATATVDLRDLMGLQENRQSFLSRSDLQGDIAKAVAWHFAHQHPALKLKGRPDLHPSFYRYISGQMSVKCQKMLDRPDDAKYPKWKASLDENGRKDLEFLRYVRVLRKSAHPETAQEDHEAAHQIALLKQMMQSILPVTLEKICKRHYGRGGEPGEVRPYLSPDTPSDNLHGFHWEAIAYHYLTVLQCHISVEHFKNLAATYRQLAEEFSQREQIPVDKTIEAKEFKNLTSVSLFDLDQPGQLELAVAHIKNSVDSLLKLEAATISECVTYHPYRLNATGATLTSMVNTIRTMSGTPHNAVCFDDFLADHFEPAWGTEGRIAHTILNRMITNPERYTHLVNSKTIETILKTVIDPHPHKARIRMLLDAGALFKDYSNYEVAKAIRDHLNLPILFFIRNPKTGEKTPDTLALFKLGSDVPIIIGGTRPEDIEKTGLGIKDYFVLLDERHVTGTDLKMPPDTIALVTLDETILRRSLFQTILRLRDYFDHQDAEFIIPKAILRTLIPVTHASPPMATILGFLLTSIKNQACKLVPHYHRSRKQLMDNVIRQEVMHNLTTEVLTRKNVKDKFNPFREATLSNQTDTPYDQFGATDHEVRGIKSLQVAQLKKIRELKRGAPPDEIVKRLTGKMEAIVKRAEDSPYLPIRLLEGGSDDLGMEVNLVCEVAVEVDRVTDQDIDQDILKELKTYTQLSRGKLRKEEPWDWPALQGLVNKVHTGAPLSTLPSLFENKHYKYQRNYQEVFDPRLIVTDTWIYTCDRALPVFHPMQRAAEDILLIQTLQGFRCILVSQREAKQLKLLLHHYYSKNPILRQVWLMQSNGVLHLDNPYGALPAHKEVGELLLQCNAFNGRIDYLESHPKLTTEWLYQTGTPTSKLDFLKLRVACNKVQKALFFKSCVLHPFASQVARNTYAREILEQIKAMGQPKIHSLTEEDKGILDQLSDEQLNLLRPDQVKWIQPEKMSVLYVPALIQAIPEKYKDYIRLHQIPNIGSHQVRWFEESVEKTQKISVALFEWMSETQKHNLCPDQIEQFTQADQLNNLHPSQWAHITVEQVNRGIVKETQVPYLRIPATLQSLDPEVLHLVEKPLRDRHLTQGQIQKLDPIKHFQVFQELTDLQVNRLLPSQIDGLHPDRIPVLTVATLIQAIPERHAAQITLEQIPHIAAHQVKWFENDKAKTQAIATTLIGEMSPLQRRHLEKSQVIPLDNKTPSAPAHRQPSPTVSTSTPTSQLESQSTPQALPTIHTTSSAPAHRQPSPTASTSTPTSQRESQAKKITRVVLMIIVGLVGTGTVIVGCFALIGMHTAFAPQFMVTIAHALGPYGTYAFLGVGGGNLLGLVGYAIYLCYRHSRPRTRSNSPTCYS
jgi:hypothetical protein